MTINERVAVRCTLVVGTMWTAYAFLAWSLLPLVAPQTTAVVTYVSQAVIQLVLLPLIMVGQSVMNRASDTRAEDVHAKMDAMMELLDEMREDLRLTREIHLVVCQTTVKEDP